MHNVYIHILSQQQVCYYLPIPHWWYTQIRERDCELVHDSQGRATGIAYITFPSRSVANQAIRDKDGKHIGSRYVELSLNWNVWLYVYNVHSLQIIMYV